MVRWSTKKEKKNKNIKIINLNAIHTQYILFASSDTIINNIDRPDRPTDWPTIDVITLSAYYQGQHICLYAFKHILDNSVCVCVEKKCKKMYVMTDWTLNIVWEQPSILLRLFHANFKLWCGFIKSTVTYNIYMCSAIYTTHHII